MKRIRLSKGKFALVDDDCFDYLSQWKWHYDGKYARRNIRVNGKLVHIYMHKVVAGTDQKVDHKDLDPLNNQRANLRACTTQTNAVNARKAVNKTSIYKGVTKRGNSWRSQLTYKNKKVYSAHFPTERWAAYAYDLNAYALYGEYARLNSSGAIAAMSVDV